MSDLEPVPAVARCVPICEVLSESLRDAGYEPVCALTAREAFALLSAGQRFACMIVDVNLGAGPTGYDVARFARGISADLPVIYVSGQTSEASQRANGVVGSLFVPKPFRRRSCWRGSASCSETTTRSALSVAPS